MTTLRRLLAATALSGVLAATAAAAPPDPSVPRADASSYRVTTVAEGLDHPWSLAFLPDGSMLVTERNGGLRVIRDGKLVAEPVAGTPQALTGGQGGLLDVAVDPDFATNGFVYLAYSEGTEDANHTAVLRAKFDGRALSESKVIFRAVPDRSTQAHYGGRLLFLPDGTLLVTLGDGFIYREEAQNLANHHGKIVRIATDGSIPSDNPFVGREGARPEIWSWGHRNVQGVAFDPETGRVFETEHGAQTGDELNVIEKGLNYGWPKATYAIDYSGAVISPHQELPDVRKPIAYWTKETLAPSGLAVYRGALFPQWNGDVLAGALAAREVRRIDLDASGAVVGQERLFTELDARIRDVRVGPDGAVWLLTDDPEGKVLRVDPAK